jgi:concanavalin A-like lectin/glucanase superfamily protein
MTTARRLFTACTLLTIVSLLCVSPSNAEIDPASIVGVWLLNEGSGNLAKDNSGHGYDADLMENPSWVAGRFGSALEFQGGSYLEIRNSAENLPFGSAEPFSITAWVKNQGGGTLMGKFNAGIVGAYIVTINGDGSVAFHREVDPWSFAGSATLPNDDFGHVAVTYDGAVMRIYINGQFDAEQERGAQNTDTVTPVLIGAQFTNGAPSSFFNGVLDEVALFNVALTEEQIREVMTGLASSKAVSPIPEDETTDVPRDTSLSWTAADTAATHNIYFGTSWEDVNAASTNAPLGVLVSEGQTETTYTPDDALAYGQTYFWRVDEVNAAPDYTVFKGNVWSFTVEAFAYPIENIIATSNATSIAGQGPENTANGSGLNANDEHSTVSNEMWLGALGAEPVYLQYEFDGVYPLHEMWVWNYNVTLEAMLGFGLKDVTIESSENGTDWTVLGDVQFAQAPGTADYTVGTIVAFDGAVAKYVKITINSGYSALGQFGLSEVRFLYLPVTPRTPQPADGEMGISVATELSWRPGRGVASHDVYLSNDEAAVAEGTAPAQTVSEASYSPAGLDLDTTYYWKVDEITDAPTVTTWEGPVWSFTTQPFLVAEDFESYNDEDNVIYETWIDGWVNETGSTVGHLSAPFAETSIVHSGSQAMPLFYDNASVTVAEATLTLGTPQNWTANGIESLSLYLHGAQDNTGQLYLKINGTKVTYNGDAADIDKLQWQPWNIDLSSIGGNLSSVTELTIGIEGAGATGVVYIDDIRLYAKVSEFVTPVEPDPANLVLHYALDEGAGNVATDSSGSGNNGTIEGSPAWITGVSGSALGFDSSRDYVTTGKSLLDSLTEFTIACWLKGDLSLGDRSGLVGQNDCIEYGIISGNTIQIWTPGGGSVNLDWPYDADTDWHSIVAVGDGTSITIYLDGRPAASGGTAITDTYGTSTFPVKIGGGGIFDDIENWLTGDVDEISIYQRALSAAEVAGLAGRTAPIAQPF